MVDNDVIELWQAEHKIATFEPDLHAGAAFMLRQPAALDRVSQPGAELPLAARQPDHERRVDPLDVDAAVLHGREVGCELEELARGRLRICIGSFCGVLHRMSHWPVLACFQ
jgi:hypothetical protein